MEIRCLGNQVPVTIFPQKSGACHLISSSPGWNVNVVETTGAGDGFLAAIIARLMPLLEQAGSLAKIDRAAVEDALRFANAVGALTCTRPGAISALPRMPEVLAFIHG